MNNKTKKLCIASILCAVAIVGSMFSIPVFGSRCSPIQHMVNILCAVTLGPWYGVGVAFIASLIRNILGIGSIMAFPGSIAYYAYIFPFFISTLGGAILSAFILIALGKYGGLSIFKEYSEVK